jgi:hypothetical protein
MKEKLLFSILLLSGPFLSFGQSILWEMPSTAADTTIVRHWRGDEYFVYTVAGSGPATVSYHDNAAPSTVSMSFPSNFRVRDFRIAHDSVFAGGTDGVSGFLACFDISDFLSGNVQVHYLNLPQGPMDGIECRLIPIGHHVNITGVDRIALYEYGSSVRIAYTAYSTITHQDAPSNVLFRSVGYGDAAFLAGLGQWDICDFHFNKDAVEVYTDICTTDNKIVIAARSDETPVDHYVRYQVFDKVRNYAQTPPMSIYTDRFGFSDHFVLGRVMVTHLKQDLVALAYHYADRVEGGLAVKAVDVGSPVPTLVNSLDIKEDMSTSAAWHMNDIRYDVRTDVLHVLNYIFHPSNGLGSYIYQIKSPFVPGASYRATFCPVMKEMHSLDNFDSQRFIASGYTLFAYTEVFIETTNTGNSCGNYDINSCVGTSPSPLPVLPRHHCTIWNPPVSLVFSPPYPIGTYQRPIHQNCEKP